LERLSLDINPKAMVDTLSASERTGVAIARALREDPEYPACLLVLDEPTATLPVDEVDHLLDRVSAMAATGVGVLYVTHHLGEVVGVAGLAGSGRDSVLGASFGALPRTAGEVTLAGQPLPAGRPDLAIGRGVAYLAPDRKIGGAVMTMSAKENLTLPDLKP